MQEVSFEEVLEQIVAKDRRYHRDAYIFVREALDHTRNLVLRENKGQPRHVTVPELLDGIRQFALGQFGPMTMTVFEEWGVRTCHDFGDIVFIMVEKGLLFVTEQDTREDFEKGYDFHEAFRKPFLPAEKQVKNEPAPRTSQSAG